ncbi:putative peptidase [Bacillus sp. TS-2]|nr:putative peptidase [Bacillus sp. TS-2]
MITITKEWKENHHYDALFIGIHEKEGLNSWLKTIDASFNENISKLYQEKQIHTKLHEITKIHTFGQMQTKAIYLVGLGKKEKWNSSDLQQAIGKVTRQTAQEKVKSVAIDVESFFVDNESQEKNIHLIMESIGLALYKVETYKENSHNESYSFESIEMIHEGGNENWIGYAQKGLVFSEGTNLSRRLINIPGNLLTPTYLAEEAEKLAQKHGFEVEILEKEQMEELGMGALLAVAAGGVEPPKMIVLKYQATDEWEDVLGLVGKGITFDSGGISLKPGLKMHEMKGDMGGAAAVLGAMDIIGQTKPKRNVLAVIPSTENMPSGSALKPGDVIRAMNGKTIEVRNTDAEGRLVLADGVSYAKQLGASELVDVATLTGAVLVALADCTTGAITNNKEWFHKVEEASEEAGEWVWAFPTHKPYHDLLKSSDVADLNNAPGRLGGSITAGLFIGEFAEETPWVHLDIAGTSWASRASHTGRAGGTGVMARTLAYLAEQTK